MKRSKREAEETRALILATATELFKTKGYSDTSIVDIVKMTNYTRGAVYWHFNNKLEIYEEIVHSSLLEIKNDIERLFTLNSSLEEILKLSLFQLSRDSKYYFVNKTIALQLAYEELFPIAKEVESVKKLYYDNLQKFIINERKKRRITGIDIDIILKFIYTIFEGTYQFGIQGVMQSQLCEKDLDFYIITIMNSILGKSPVVKMD